MKYHPTSLRHLGLILLCSIWLSTPIVAQEISPRDEFLDDFATDESPYSADFRVITAWVKFETLLDPRSEIDLSEFRDLMAEYNFTPEELQDQAKAYKLLTGSSTNQGLNNLIDPSTVEVPYSIAQVLNFPIHENANDGSRIAYLKMRARFFTRLGWLFESMARYYQSPQAQHSPECFLSRANEAILAAYANSASLQPEEKAIFIDFLNAEARCEGKTNLQQLTAADPNITLELNFIYMYSQWRQADFVVLTAPEAAIAYLTKLYATLPKDKQQMLCHHMIESVVLNLTDHRLIYSDAIFKLDTQIVNTALKWLGDDWDKKTISALSVALMSAIDQSYIDYFYNLLDQHARRQKTNVAALIQKHITLQIANQTNTPRIKTDGLNLKPEDMPFYPNVGSRLQLDGNCQGIVRFSAFMKTNFKFDVTAKAITAAQKKVLFNYTTLNDLSGRSLRKAGLPQAQDGRFIIGGYANLNTLISDSSELLSQLQTLYTQFYTAPAGFMQVVKDFHEDLQQSITQQSTALMDHQNSDYFVLGPATGNIQETLQQQFDEIQKAAQNYGTIELVFGLVGKSRLHSVLVRASDDPQVLLVLDSNYSFTGDFLHLYRNNNGNILIDGYEDKATSADLVTPDRLETIDQFLANVDDITENILLPDLNSNTAAEGDERKDKGADDVLAQINALAEKLRYKREPFGRIALFVGYTVFTPKPLYATE